MSDEPSLRRGRAGLVIWACAAVLSVAWFIEAFTRGRGFVSKYVAPLAIVGNLVGAFLMWKRPPRS